MLRRLKLLLLAASNRLGVSSTVLGSEWRRQRLLILCYHGTSLEDEHEWNGGLYIPPQRLRSRLEYLRRARCNVLDFGQAVDLLYRGELPPRAVAITYDDGAYDFYARAFPIIHEFGFPVTVYWTTYYAEYNRPVFDLACSYLLWKGRPKTIALPEAGIERVRLDDSGRQHAWHRLIQHARSRNLTASDKNALLARLAGTIGIDYESLCARRTLCIMTAAEARELAAAGVSLQLHTHRHRTPEDEGFFRREIEDNRRRIEAVSSSRPEHFCYPSGLHLPAFSGWLRDNGVRTATTCEPGICTRATDPMLMPRLLDITGVSTTEFAAWVSGVASWLPQRQAKPSAEVLASRQIQPRAV